MDSNLQEAHRWVREHGTINPSPQTQERLERALRHRAEQTRMPKVES